MGSLSDHHHLKLILAWSRLSRTHPPLNYQAKEVARHLAKFTKALRKVVH